MKKIKKLRRHVYLELPKEDMERVNYAVAMAKVKGKKFNRDIVTVGTIKEIKRVGLWNETISEKR